MTNNAFSLERKFSWKINKQDWVKFQSGFRQMVNPGHSWLRIYFNIHGLNYFAGVLGDTFRKVGVKQEN